MRDQQLTKVNSANMYISDLFLKTQHRKTATLQVLVAWLEKKP